MNRLLALRRLSPSIQEHRRVESEHARLLRLFLAEGYIAPPAKPLGALRYVRKNFFSILFLSIYRAIGIPEERRLLYGSINHAVRGIVTATDNLLDNEYKELLPLRFPSEAIRFKSVMHILLFDRFLSHLIDASADQGLIPPGDRHRIQKAILDALVPIGEEEATEEGGVKNILTPEEILDRVHVHKGGNLLRLSFVVPRLIENAAADRVELADRGVFHIGMALQMIDDVTDLYDDVRDRRHNYLVSSICHEGNASEQTRLQNLLVQGGRDLPVEQAFPSSTARVLERAVLQALEGFDLLAEGGFWLERRQALALIRYLFRLRGVGDLLPLLPKGLHRPPPARVVPERAAL